MSCNTTKEGIEGEEWNDEPSSVVEAGEGGDEHSALIAGDVTARSSSGRRPTTPKTSPLNVFQFIMGECFAPCYAPHQCHNNNHYMKYYEPPDIAYKYNKNRTGTNKHHYQQQENQPSFFIQLHGVEFISLGSAINARSMSPKPIRSTATAGNNDNNQSSSSVHTAKQRVDETIEQLMRRMTRLISIGYLATDEEKEDITPTATTTTTSREEPTTTADDNNSTSSSSKENRHHHVQEQEEDKEEKKKSKVASASSEVIDNITIHTVPYEVWIKNYPNDHLLSNHIDEKIINYIKTKQFNKALNEFKILYNKQKSHMHESNNNNKYLIGITAHNIAVLEMFISYVNRTRKSKGHNNTNKDSRSRSPISRSTNDRGNNNNNHESSSSTSSNNRVLHAYQKAYKLKKQFYYGTATGSNSNTYNTDNAHLHSQIALTLNEIGIQLFALNKFDDAVHIFNDVKKIYNKIYHSTSSSSSSTNTDTSRSSNMDNLVQNEIITPPITNPSSKEEEEQQQHVKMAMVLNNIACCNFQLKNSLAALLLLQEAYDIQIHAMKGGGGGGGRSNKKDKDNKTKDDDSKNETTTTTKDRNTNSGSKSATRNKNTISDKQQQYGIVVDLDLLHVAITLCNLGYMKLRLKQYEDASSSFEEALLIQQSVFGADDKNISRNQTIQDTLSNIEFANAFHS